MSQVQILYRPPLFQALENPALTFSNAWKVSTLPFPTIGKTQDNLFQASENHVDLLPCYHSSSLRMAASVRRGMNCFQGWAGGGMRFKAARAAWRRRMSSSWARGSRRARSSRSPRRPRAPMAEMRRMVGAWLRARWRAGTRTRRSFRRTQTYSAVARGSGPKVASWAMARARAAGTATSSVLAPAFRVAGSTSPVKNDAKRAVST